MVTDKPTKDWPESSKDKPNKAGKSHQGKPQTITTNGATSAKSSEVKDVSKLEFIGLTRGKMLATKTPQSSSNKTKDVLETAVKLDMKILTHRSILDFCKKYIKISLDDLAGEQKQLSNEPDNSTSGSSSKVKVKQLKAPFLKFEDNEERFAPVYKEFDIWPSVCIDANSSQLVTTNYTNNPNPTNNQPTPTVPKNFSTKLIQQLPKKRQRVLFCEICSKEFTNMIEVIVFFSFLAQSAL